MKPKATPEGKGKYMTLYFIQEVFFFCIIAMVHKNSPTVEIYQEKIEGNLRRANKEPSVDFRRANTETY